MNSSVQVSDTSKWRDMLKQMKYDYLERTARGFFIASGGRSMKIKSYDDRTANKLTAALIDFLKFSGHYANRVNSQGQVRTEKVELAFGNSRDIVRWTKGQTNKGSGDVFSIIYSKAYAFEIKIGPDKMSKAQHKERERFEASGGTYLVVKDFPSFLQWYNETIKKDATV